MDSFYETWWLPGDSRIRSWDATVHHEDLVVQHMAQRRGTEDLREEVRHLLLVLHLTAGTSKKKRHRWWISPVNEYAISWINGLVQSIFFRKLDKLGVLPPTPRHGWVYAIDIMGKLEPKTSANRFGHLNISQQRQARIRSRHATSNSHQ